MNTDSRTKNSARNAFLGIIFQIINILCSFIVRTIFITCLSASYLGINGLFTNILSLLSLADLGFDTAIIYSLYKPISENNTQKISALMNYFKKIYNIIGFLVLVFGLGLIPFLKYIINLQSNIGNITVYYILYLLNTSFTYLLANRVAIINADQRMYIVKRISFVFSIIQMFLQSICLIIFHSFIMYLIIQIICTLAKNIYGAIKANKLYPFLKNNKFELNSDEKKEIFNNTKSFMIYKIGGVILNDTDNILISSLILTEIVGIYSNYTIIISAFTTMITLFFSSMLASIGNLNVNSSEKKQEEILYKIKFLSVWVYGVCSICLFLLLNDFIYLMWGEEYVMNIIIPLAALINFLIVGLIHPFRLYRETTSAFKEIKYIYLITSVINLILSFILAKIMPTIELKLFGIIIATAIARLLTNYWVEPKKIINIVFKKSSLSYFKENILDIFIILFCGIITYLCVSNIIVNNWLILIVKSFVCFLISNLLFVLAYRKNENFKFYINLLKKIKK